MVSFQQSQRLYERSSRLAPAGVHSPVRAFRAVGGHPIFFEKGLGTKLWDVDGNEYVDFCNSWGALALGHAHPDIVEAVRAQVVKGTHFGTPTPLDVELAELALSALAPFDRLRFVNSGTEAVMTAVRLARGYTGRDKILKFDGTYHGHVDSLLVNAGSGVVTQGLSSSAGVTQGSVNDTLVIPYGNIEALETVFKTQGDQIAALILEPVLANNGLFEIAPNYMKACRDLTYKHGSLLIFDEVITGFRLAWGGAKEYLKVEPDLGTYGKILGGGLPVGAIAGPEKYMNTLAPMGKVYQAGTLSGNPIAMAAGLATLRGIQKVDHYGRVRELGKYLDKKMDQLRSVSSKAHIHYHRVEGLFWICPGAPKAPASPGEIDQKMRDAFKESYHPILRKGIYLAPSVYEVGFISSAHTKEDLDKLVGALATT